MSRQVIDAVAGYSRRTGKEVTLIASRNQVDCDAFGGGYVGGFTTASFAKYVRSLEAPQVLLARDHSGPYFSQQEASLRPEDAVAATLASIREDIDACFDIIHIDCSKHRGDIREATAYLIREAMQYAKDVGRSIRFEVGTEENVGTQTSPAKFKADLDFVCNVCVPEFVVGQTGSLVKEVFQVGSFDLIGTRELTRIAHSFGVKFKEHNADYTGSLQLRQRRLAGVDAVNVAPEFGVCQTRTTMFLAQEYGLREELDSFLRVAEESGCWKKWIYGEPSPVFKALIAGHYVFASDEYQSLLTQLSRKVDVYARISEELQLLIDHYVKGMR